MSCISFFMIVLMLWSSAPLCAMEGQNQRDESVLAPQAHERQQGAWGWFSGTKIAQGLQSCWYYTKVAGTGLAKFFAWPFKKAGAAVVEGAFNQVQQQLAVPQGQVDVLPPGPPLAPMPDVPAFERRINDFVATVLRATNRQLMQPNEAQAGLASQIIKNFYQSSWQAFADLFEAPAAQQGGQQGPLQVPAGVQLLNNATRAIGDLYRRGGEGRRAIEDFVNLFRDFVKNEGVIKQALNDAQKLIYDELSSFFKMIKEMNLDDGAMAQAQVAMMKNIAQGARSLETAAQSLGNQVNTQVDQLGRNIAIAGSQVDTQLQAIDSRVDQIGDTVNSQYLKIAKTTVIAGVILITALYGSRVLWNYIDRSLNKPKLVIESSQKTVWQRVKGLFVHDVISIPEMIFSTDLYRRLSTITAATQNIQKKIKQGQKNVKYRNLLLWGPPGTGKTMFAKILALSSGMDYAILSGASFAQFKEGTGITEMNKLFEWASRSPEGLLIFIDEADSFLGGRVGEDVTQDAYQLLNNFLHHTGTRSDKFMFVFATNHPEFLDKAMLRRIDDAVELKLPEHNERARILHLYCNKILLDEQHNSKEFILSVQEYFGDEVIDKVAHQTTGLSGGELEGIINGIITDASVTEDGLVTPRLIADVTEQAIQKNQEFESHFGRPAVAQVT